MTAKTMRRITASINRHHAEAAAMVDEWDDDGQEFIDARRRMLLEAVQAAFKKEPYLVSLRPAALAA